MIHAAVKLARRYSHINWALADQAMVSGSNFVTNILLARILGAAEFGKYVLVWMVVLFIQSVQHAAVNSPMMTIGPKQEPETQLAYYGAVFIQQIVFALLTAGLVYVCVRYGSELFPQFGTDRLALPLTAAVFFCQLQDFLRRYYFTVHAPFHSFIGDFIRYIGQIAILFWIYYESRLHLSVGGIIWIVAVISSVSVFFMLFLAFLNGLAWPDGKLWSETARRHWKFSKWLILSALMQWTSGQVFFIVAGALISTAAVGAMRAAQSFVGIFHILFLGLENALPSRLSVLARERGVEAVYKTLNTSAWLLFSITSLCFLAVLEYDGFIMEVLYGSEYSVYSFVLILFSLGYVFSSLGVIFRMALRFMEKTFPVFLSMLLATLWSVLSSWWLGSNYGIVGIMYGLVFYFAIQALVPFLSLMVFRYFFWPINFVKA